MIGLAYRVHVVRMSYQVQVDALADYSWHIVPPYATA
jgi:hypothetical protein